jgi:hypothetical protein
MIRLTAVLGFLDAGDGDGDGGLLTSRGTCGRHALLTQDAQFLIRE